MELFDLAWDRVDYVIVHNPAMVRSDLFSGSGLEKELLGFGARSLILPSITPVTLNAIKRAEATANRKLSFGEVTRSDAGHLERMLAGEMQWAMQRMFPQYLAAAELLLPTDLIPDGAGLPPAKPEAKAPRQRHLNLGE